MASAYEIPLSPTPQQITIALGGVQYRLTVKWNAAAAVWQFDLATLAGVPILSGLPLVTGCDLLGQFEYLALGGELWASTDHDAALPPAFDNLGTSGHLYWIVR